MKLRREDFTKIMFGVVALVLGFLFLLSAFGAFDLKTIWPYWTLFIIIPTIGSMIANGVNIWKTALLAAGINALIVQTHWGDWEWKQFVAANVAVILILAGVLLIFGNVRTEGVFKRMDRKSGQDDEQPNFPPPYDQQNMR
jgi:hypothetical protein